MNIEYAVWDWNGTLFKPPTDDDLNRAIGQAIKSDFISGIFKRGKFWNLPRSIVLALYGKPATEEALDRYKAGNATLKDAYDAFNMHIIKGTPVRVIHDAFDKFADEKYFEVDTRMMDPIWDFFENDGRNGILSVSQENVIWPILMLAGYDGAFSKENIIANRLECSKDRARKLTLKIYGEKAKVFENSFLDERRFKRNKTIYSGDTDDDLPVAEFLPRGRFVVPFYATKEFRELATKKYGAFAPKNQKDFQNFLLKS